jgi:hypothetical protein
MATDPELERDFPNLARSHYRITSPSTPRYNCIAWAADRTDRWWEPVEGEQYFWPPGATFEYGLEPYTEAFEAIGYERCPTPDPELGYRKVALYARGDIAYHAAKQLVNGMWSSKLGDGKDIVHEHLEAIEGPEYGWPVRFLRRRYRASDWIRWFAHRIGRSG